MTDSHPAAVNPDDLAVHADAAGLILAAVDDRPALVLVVNELTHAEAVERLVAAVDLGGVLLVAGDRQSEQAPRAFLLAFLAGHRLGGVGR